MLFQNTDFNSFPYSPESWQQIRFQQFTLPKMINVPEIFITNDGGREKCKSRRPQLEVLEGGYSCSPVGNQDDYV